MIFLLSFSSLAGKVIIINESEGEHLLQFPNKDILVKPKETKTFNVPGIKSVKIDDQCYKSSNEEGITKIIITRDGRIETQIINP